MLRSKAFYKTVTIYLLLTTKLSVAQNLVPDSSFENMVKVPTKEANTIFCTKDWIVPSYSSSDYYNSAALDKSVGVPNNLFGNQEAHSGNGYAGICIQKDLIEYLQSKLTEPLINGKKYLVEFYISKADLRIDHVKQFGILFTDKIQLGYARTGIPHKPPVDFTNAEGYKDENGWTKLSTVYTAQGYETAFIVGYFNYDQPKGFKGKAHYYIDDVTISPLEKEKPVAVIIKNDTTTASVLPKIGEVTTLKNIFFATDKSELLPSSFAEVDKLVAVLKNNPSTTIHISGHTDNTGIEEHNKKLSEARAQAVANQLSLKGIDKTRITFTGYGSAKPIVANDTEENKQQNRRVEFIISNR